MDDEVLDLVDAEDVVIGTILRTEYHRLNDEKLGYIRAVDMFIQNDKGKLWIPTRTADKTIAPSGLDYSMGGHVGSGETYIEATLRETQEELNLTLTASDLQVITKFEPTDLPYFRMFYIYKSNQTPSFNPEDFVSAEWLTPQEIIQKIDAGTPAKSSLRPTVEFLVQAQTL